MKTKITTYISAVANKTTKDTFVAQMPRWLDSMTRSTAPWT